MNVPPCGAPSYLWQARPNGRQASQTAPQRFNKRPPRRFQAAPERPMTLRRWPPGGPGLHKMVPKTSPARPPDSS
eukprot:7928504-Pyramimonas_sp.AAC.1